MDESQIYEAQLTDFTPDPHNANRGTERGLFQPAPAFSPGNITYGLLGNAKFLRKDILRHTACAIGANFKNIVLSKFRLPIIRTTDVVARRILACAMPYAILVIFSVGTPTKVINIIVFRVTIQVARLKSRWLRFYKGFQNQPMHIYHSIIDANHRIAIFRFRHRQKPGPRGIDPAKFTAVNLDRYNLSTRCDKKAFRVFNGTHLKGFCHFLDCDRNIHISLPYIQNSIAWLRNKCNE